MDIDKNLFAQTFAGVIIIVLLITFYILLVTDLARGTQNLLTPMVLLVISIVLVAIFSVLYKMEIRMDKQTEAAPKPVVSKKGGKK